MYVLGMRQDLGVASDFDATCSMANWPGISNLGSQDKVLASCRGPFEGESSPSSEDVHMGGFVIAMMLHLAPRRLGEQAPSTLFASLCASVAKSAY